MQPTNMIIHIASNHVLWVLKSNHISSERSNQMTKGKIDWHPPTEHVKGQILEKILEGIFLDTNRINQRIHIVGRSYSQLSARSRIFCLLVGVIYWPWGLKFVYSTINLAFLEIIIKLNFLQNFTCNFEWFCPQISSDAKYFFLSGPRLCDR